MVTARVESPHRRVLEGEREQPSVGAFDGRPLMVEFLEFLRPVRDLRAHRRVQTDQHVTPFLLEVLRVESGTGDRRQLHLPFDDNYTYRILRLLNHRVMVSKVERSWGFREQDFVSGNRKVHHLKTHVSTPSWPLVALDRSPFPPEAG